MTIKEIRKAAGMTQKEFAEYFGMSKRNVENWEGGTNKCPPYLLALIKYKLQKEGLLKEPNNQFLDNQEVEKN